MAIRWKPAIVAAAVLAALLPGVPASAARMMWCRDSPASFGPSPIGIRAFVATSTSSRAEPSASPRISSLSPAE